MGIQEETLREIDVNQYRLIKENGQFSLDFGNDLLDGRSYIIKVSGKSDIGNPDPIHTEARLTQRYFNYNPYWTASGRYIPYGTYTESFTYNAGVVKNQEKVMLTGLLWLDYQTVRITLTLQNPILKVLH